jgi:hypothetical protein
LPQAITFWTGNEKTLDEFFGKSFALPGTLVEALSENNNILYMLVESLSENNNIPFMHFHISILQFPYGGLSGLPDMKKSDMKKFFPAMEYFP